MRQFLIYSFISFLIFGCVETFIPKINNFEESFLIVDGSISNIEGPYAVNLMLTSDLNSISSPVSGASVVIESRSGLSEELDEFSTGQYKTNSMIGVVGESYKLTVSFNEDIYQSDWETINQAPKIDSIYYQSRTIEIGQFGKKSELDGIQFHVNVKGRNQDSRFFRFEWDETWKIDVEYPLKYDYLGNDIIQEPNTASTTNTCWRNALSNDINIATTFGLSENSLLNYEVGFVDPNNQRFKNRYSHLIRLIELSEKEYLFWKNLKESNDDTGGLFEKQPAKVVGNMTNITNNNNIVLGYFSASGVSEKRMFISGADIYPLNIYSKTCAVDTIRKTDFTSNSAYEETVQNKINSGNFYFYTLNFPDCCPWEIQGCNLVKRECADCKLNGDDPKKPEFWID